MMNKWKQLLCKHSFFLIGKHTHVSENLYRCPKCDVYLVHHVGIGLSYKTNKIDIREWAIKK